MTTVLIVDDSAMDRQIAEYCVKEAGCEVISVGDGNAALETVQQGKIDVVLTDLQMPEMDGLELVRNVTNNHPNLPIILMTAFGSEQIAVEALRAGAASYVPKKNLRQDLGEALRTVVSAVEAAEQRDQVQDFLEESTSRFVLGYEAGGPQALLSYLQDSLHRLNFCDDSTMFQLTMALSEAITNAIDHGNLELDSEWRNSNDYRRIGDERAKQPPYCDRRVRLEATLTPTEARFVVRDEGPGFDPTTLPDSTDAENLLKPSGRGVMLMRTFLDEVTFNERGNEVTLIKRRDGAASSKQ